MATKKKEWTSKELARFEETKSMVWIAQKSTSPQGDVFVGVRKFRVDAEGNLMPAGHNGIQVKIEAAATIFPELSKLLKKAMDAAKTNEESDDSDDEEADEPKPKAKKGSGKYVLTTKSGTKFVVYDGDDVTYVTRANKATQFTKAEAEELMGEYEDGSFKMEKV